MPKTPMEVGLCMEGATKRSVERCDLLGRSNGSTALIECGLGGRG